MKVTPEMIDAMLSAGLTTEQMGSIVKAGLAAEEASRAAADEARKAKAREGNRERQARWRERNANNESNAVTDRDGRDPPPKIYNSTPHQALPADPNGSAAPTPRKARKRALPEGWSPNETCDAVRQELGRSVEWMAGCVAEMRTWALGKGEIRADWDMVFQGWMRREAKRECERGGGPPSPNGRGPPSGQRVTGLAQLGQLKNFSRRSESHNGPTLDIEPQPSSDRDGRFAPDFPERPRDDRDHEQGPRRDGTGQVYDLPRSRAFG